MGYGDTSRKIIAIDNNLPAVRKLEKPINVKNNMDRFETVLSDFYEYREIVDLLVFEFSLHEMDGIKRALEHAKSIAKKVLIIDHENGGEWIRIVQELGKVESEDRLLAEEKCKRKKTFWTVRRFEDYKELLKKIEIQGPSAIYDIEKYKGKLNIEIPMYYKLLEK